MLSLKKFIIKCIEFYNYIYKLLAYNAGKTVWFKQLPFSARLICFVEHIDEDFLYKLHLCGVEWNSLVYEILRLGFPLNLFLNTLKQEYIIQYRNSLELNTLNLPFLEEQSLLLAYETTKKLLGLHMYTTLYRNFYEKIAIDMYLRLNSLEESTHSIPLGVDPTLRRIWTFFYFLSLLKLI